MKNSNKIFNKIRSVIYNQEQGLFTDEEAYKKIKEIMNIHNLLGKSSRIYDKTTSLLGSDSRSDSSVID